MKKSRHRVSKKEALKEIASALEGIESEFEWQGFSSEEQASGQPEALPDAPGEEKEEEQESEEDGGEEEEESDEYIGFPASTPRALRLRLTFSRLT